MATSPNLLTGAVNGWEGERRGREAGIRTYLAKRPRARAPSTLSQARSATRAEFPLASLPGSDSSVQTSFFGTPAFNQPANKGPSASS